MSCHLVGTILWSQVTYWTGAPIPTGRGHLGSERSATTYCQITNSYFESTLIITINLLLLLIQNIFVLLYQFNCIVGTEFVVGVRLDRRTWINRNVCVVKVMLSTVIVWSICGVLTATDTIPNDPNHWAYNTRTDTKSYVLHASPWFQLPYPCMLFFCAAQKHDLQALCYVTFH